MVASVLETTVKSVKALVHRARVALVDSVGSADSTDVDDRKIRGTEIESKQ